MKIETNNLEDLMTAFKSIEKMARKEVKMFEKWQAQIDGILEPYKESGTKMNVEDVLANHPEATGYAKALLMVYESMSARPTLWDRLMGRKHRIVSPPPSVLFGLNLMVRIIRDDILEDQRKKEAKNG